ncbi:MAG: AlpA family phage regulatory protein [Alphaproteobacteria bacterium]|nr:AlpA family phage regulatory protein [Alphaproteobacteria bacterium]
MSNQILRKPAVLARIGIKNSTLYDWIAKGNFPRPLHLSERSVGWLEADVEAFIAKRVEESRGGSDA